MTVGFIDNDIAMKMIAFQLWDKAIGILNLSSENLRVIPSAKYRYQDRLKRHQEYPDEILIAGIAFFESHQSATTKLDMVEEANQLTSLMKKLPNERKGIDKGEAILVLAAREQSDFLILTGDKSFLRALLIISPEDYTHLCGRVICLEQLILKLIDELGFGIVSDRIRLVAGYDSSINHCFGVSVPASEAAARQGLQGNINALHELVPGILADLSQFAKQ